MTELSPTVRNETDWNASQKRFLEAWATTQFGGVGEQAAALYGEYFALPHVASGRSDEWIGASLGKLGGGGVEAVVVKLYPRARLTRHARLLVYLS